MVYSVIIPTHNEGKNIGKLILKVYKILRKCKYLDGMI